MKGCYCPNCGERQKYRLDVLSKIEEPCPKCGKPLLVRRDKTGMAVKVFDADCPAFNEPSGNQSGRQTA